MATIISITPGVLIYIHIGTGLSDILQADTYPNLNTILEFKFILPLIALAILVMLHLIYKKIVNRKKIFYE